MVSNPQRWRQRFANFNKAQRLLSEPLTERPLEDFSDLEKQGLIQRFEFCFELAWKTMKDYLDYNGVTVDPITPRHVIKQAFASQIITDGHGWIAMLDQRNALALTYYNELFLAALIKIKTQFLPLLEQLHTFFMQKSSEI